LAEAAPVSVWSVRIEYGSERCPGSVQSLQNELLFGVNLGGVRFTRTE